MAGRAGIALVYAFSAWMAAACCVYAGGRLFPGQEQAALRCAAVALCYFAVFRLYFSRGDVLPATGAAVLCVGLVAVIDWLVVARHLPNPSLFFRSWRGWGLPAVSAFGSVICAGRLRQ